MLTALTLMCLGIGSTDKISEADFHKLHQELQPKADEAWRSIPWTLSVLEGQRKAVAAKKPLFIWAMDGHPLGCT